MAALEAGGLAAAITGASIYTTLLPPLAEVRRATTDSATARDVRTGLAMATAALVGTGVIIAMAEQDPKPMLLTVALAALMGGIYEITLRRPPEGDVGTSSAPGSWHLR